MALALAKFSLAKISCYSVYICCYNVHAFLQWVDDMADAGADQYTFHLEATSEYDVIMM